MIEDKPTHAVIKSVFKEVVSITHNINVECWANCGTLLRIIRGDDMLTNGADIDMVTLKGPLNLRERGVFLRAMNASGYRSCSTRSKLTFFKDGVKVDIWYLSQNGDVASRVKWEPNTFLSKIVYKIASLRCLAGNPFWLAGVVEESFNRLLQHLGARKYVFSVPARYVKSFKRIPYEDISVLVPEDAEGYLEYRYGEDWRTPKGGWDHIRDDAAWSVI